jgi:hypothetical protein
MHQFSEFLFGHIFLFTFKCGIETREDDKRKKRGGLSSPCPEESPTAKPHDRGTVSCG